MIRFVEADNMAEVASSILSVSMTREAISPARIEKQILLDPNFDAGGSILAYEDDQPIGYALSVLRKVPTEGEINDPEKGYLWLLGVIPSARMKGVGTELLNRVEGYVREAGRKVMLASCYSPGYFQPGIDVEAYSGGLEFLKNRGYAEVYRPLAMEASLWDHEVPEWVDQAKLKLEQNGVRFSRNGRELISDLLRFSKKEFGVDWARFVRESLLRQIDGDQKTGLSIAVENGEVIGFGHFDSERFGPIGIAASERGRCLGQILMWDILAQQRERGFRSSWFLWSDDKTAHKLYAHAGFTIVRRFALLKKELS